MVVALNLGNQSDNCLTWYGCSRIVGLHCIAIEQEQNNLC